jgi:hypothetical protein
MTTLSIEMKTINDHIRSYRTNKHLFCFIIGRDINRHIATMDTKKHQ